MGKKQGKTTKSTKDAPEVPLRGWTRTIYAMYVVLIISVAATGIFVIALEANHAYGTIPAGSDYRDDIEIYPTKSSTVKTVNFWFDRYGNNAGDLIVSPTPENGIYDPLEYYVELYGSATIEPYDEDRDMGSVKITRVLRNDQFDLTTYDVKVYRNGLNAKASYDDGSDGGDYSYTESVEFPRTLIRPNRPIVRENESSVQLSITQLDVSQFSSIKDGVMDAPGKALSISVQSKALFSDTTFGMMRPAPSTSESGDALIWQTNNGSLSLLAQGSKQTSINTWLGYVLAPAAATGLLAWSWKVSRSKHLKKASRTTRFWIGKRLSHIRSRNSKTALRGRSRSRRP